MHVLVIDHMRRQEQLHQRQPTHDNLIPFPGIQNPAPDESFSERNESLLTHSTVEEQAEKLQNDDAPIHTMAKLMKAGLIELEQKKNMSKQPIDNRPVTTEIVFATYNLVDEETEQPSIKMPSEYEQPVPLMKNSSKPPKITILASYDVARETGAAGRNIRPQSFSDYSVIDDNRSFVGARSKIKHKEI